MFRYYQTESNQTDTWKVVPDKDAEKIRAEQATHMTALAVSLPHYEGVNYAEAKYRGDFAMDIDCAGNLPAAIASANALLDYLQPRCNLDDLRLFISGGKGFHIFIPWVMLWGDVRSKAHLPRVYKSLAVNLASEAGIVGIDLQLYAAGRGHTLRVENKLRPDGKYKVPVSVEEVRGMTPEQYAELSARPRFDFPYSAPNTIVAGIHALAIQAEKMGAETSQVVSIPVEYLKDFHDKRYPTCIQKLISNEDVDASKNFNQIALQVAHFIRSVSLTADGQRDLISQMAVNLSGDKTAAQREQHMTSQVLPYIKQGAFSCAAMRGLVRDRAMCEGCPVQTRRHEENTETTQIVERTEGEACGYWRTDTRGDDVQLTNFVIELEKIYAPDSYAESSVNMWVGAQAAIRIQGIVEAFVDLQPANFLSAQEFRKAIAPSFRAEFHGKDEDVFKIFHYIKRLHKDTEKMTVSSTVGVRDQTFTDPVSQATTTVKVWVEPGWSLAYGRVTNTLRFERDDLPTVAKLQHRKATGRADAAATDVMLRLLRSNKPDVVGKILGWVMATHLKTHIVGMTRSFPLLHLCGLAGSGKTQTAMLYCALAGADYRGGPMAADSATPYPIREATCESTTVPRIFDEVNQSKMNESKYTTIRNALKTCYQQSAVTIGTLSGKHNARRNTSAQTLTFNATSPMIYTATSLTGDAELWDRSMDVHMDRSYHRHGEFKQLFEDAKAWETLFDIAKMFVLRSLDVSNEDARKRYRQAEDSVSAQLTGRARVAYGTIYFGLNYALRVFTDMGYSAELLAALNHVIEKSREDDCTRLDLIVQQRSKTELDNWLEFMNGAAAQIKNGHRVVVPGIHYVRRKDVLFLDIPAVFQLYSELCQRQVRRAEFSKTSQLELELRNQSYYLGAKPLPEGCRTDSLCPSWTVLDLKAITERGTDVSRFIATA